MPHPFVALHPAQQDIYLDQLIHPDSPRYNIGGCIKLIGQLDTEKFKEAVRSVPEVFDVFRVQFDFSNPEPRCYFPASPPRYAIEELDFSQEADPEGQANDWMQTRFNTAFALDQALFEVYLLKINEQEHWFYNRHHHLLIDGYGFSIWAQYIGKKYQALVANQEVQFTYPSYLSEAQLASHYYDSPAYQAEGDYWKKKIKASPAPLFQAQYPATNQQGKKSGQYIFNATDAQRKQIEALQVHTRASLQQLTLAALTIYFARTTGESDFMCGIPIHKRRSRNQRAMVGVFSGDIPFLGTYDPDRKLIDFIRDITASQKQDYRYQNYLLGDISRFLQHHSSKGHLFDVMVNYAQLNYGFDFGSELHVTTYEISSEYEAYPLQLWWRDYGPQQPLQLRVDFHYQYFTFSEAETFVGRLMGMLAQFQAGLDRSVSELTILPDEEAHTLLGWSHASNFNQAFNASQTTRAASAYSLRQALWTQLEEGGERVAIHSRNAQLSYAQIQQQSSRLADALHQHGLVPGDHVAVLLDRSPQLLIALLALWQNGLVYLPVDPTYPPERIAFMLTDAQPALVLTQPDYQPLSESYPTRLLTDLLADSLSEAPVIWPPVDAVPGGAAYLIYTSGSTGQPKGVLVSEANLDAFAQHLSRHYLDQGPVSMPWLASASFDISLFQLLLPLLSGGTILLADAQHLADLEELARLLEGATALDTVPALYQGLVQHLAGQAARFERLRQVFIGGDAIPDALLGQLAEVFSSARIVVTYGPTEGTIFCAHRVYEAGQLPAGVKGAVMGRPLASAELYVLDAQQQLLPVGIEGELCIGGAGVSQGYWNRPALMGEKFIAHPFSADPTARLYRTGDWARWTREGELEFRGRRDSQVKIRGFRIELGEIENHIRQHEAIADTVVSTVTTQEQGPVLAAYYLEKNRVQVWPSISEYLGYNEIAYYAMNKDELRAGSYQKAIQQLVKGKVVVDVGTGPEAILAQHCLAAGALKVYAIEILDDIYQKAKIRIAALGLQDRIILIHGNVMDVELPEKVDYCVCALVGNMGSSDGCIPIMNSARRFLKDARCMIPYRSLSKIAAISLPEDQVRVELTETGAYYVNHIFDQARQPFDLRIGLQNVSEHHLISTEDTFEDLDLTTYLAPNHSHAIELTLTADASMSGFLVWLNLYTTPDIVNNIFKSQQSFLPIYFPVFEQERIAAQKGDQIRATVWRATLTDGVYPDYGIQGEYIRATGEIIPFLYVSKRLPGTLGANSFYQRLFPQGQVVVQPAFSGQVLRQFLEKRLPQHLLPNFFVPLKKLPLTAHGKVDRKALPDPQATETSKGHYFAPRNTLESTLVTIWQERLGVERVGLDDNFFDLGGHSLVATRTVSMIRKQLSVELAIKDLFTYPTVRTLAEHVQKQRMGVKTPALLPQPRLERIPLSFSQERLWFIDQLEGSVQYHIPVVFRLKGKLHPEALRRALQTLVNRHEILRTTIRKYEGQAYQHLLETDQWQLSVPESVLGQEVDLPILVANFIHQPFDLASQHPLRASLIPLSEEEHVLVITVHHIAADGWSMPLLVDELSVLYRAYLENRPVDLAALPLQYADYALWQRQYLQGEVLAEQLAYWQEQLTGVEPLQLPADFARPASSSTRGAALAFSLDETLSTSLQALSRQEGSTLFMTLLAAFQVLLSRYSGQTDICVGSAIANREQSEVEGLIGFFANALALRSDLSGNPSFIRLLQRVKQTTLEAYEHQQVPFEKVVDAVVQQRDRSRSPLFQVMFDLQNNATVELATMLTGVALTVEAMEHRTTKFELTFTMVETAEGLVGSVEYATDLFLPATIERMVEHFRHLLRAIVADPHQPISQLDLLSAGERRRLLEDFQGRVVTRDPSQTVLSLFADQVRRTPEAMALVFEQESLSFAQLNEAANRLALLLVEQGVGTETLVPLLLEPGFEQVMAVLAVWKAGGAYVPLDPATPAGRLHFLLQDTGATLLLTTSTTRPSQPLPDAVIVLEIDQLDLLTGSEELDNSQFPPASFPVVKPEQLAYVLYTSGSTGEPKGVMIQHNSLCHYLTNHQTHYLDTATLPVDPSGTASAGGGSYQLLSYGFDASLTSSWLPLLAGQPLVLAPSSGSALFEQPTLAQHAPYGFLKLTPAHLPLLALAQGAPFTSRLVVGGEALLSSQLQALAEVGTELEIINEYGPTEATVGVTTFRFLLSQLKSLPSRLPIGKPLDNTQLYLLDSQRQLVPLGVVGEICLAGVSLARGYWNRPELTREKFIPHPFSQEPTARLYRTGDLGRWLPDGTLLYEGRLDEQVKIRGYRIEPGEIEAVLVQSGRVEQAVVVSQATSENNAQLLAYVVAKGEWDPEGVQAYLAEHLPAYLLPSQLVVLPQLPLTTNGKIDKAALPQLQANPATTGYVAPRNELEQTIARIWQDLLEVEPVGIHDDFFQLGGDSIKIISVVSKLQKELGKEIKMFEVYQAGTLAQLALLISNLPEAKKSPQQQANAQVASELALLKKTVLANLPDADTVEDVYPMSDIQSGMVYGALAEPALAIYHDQMVYPLIKDINVPVFEKAFSLLVQQHEILRTAFQLNLHSEGVQVVYQATPVRIAVHNLAHLSEQHAKEQVYAYLLDQRGVPFEVGKAPLWRAELFSLAHQTLLVFQCHHAILDGWSVASFNTELNNLYLRLEKGEEVTLPALGCRHLDFIRESLVQKRTEENRDFWETELADYKRLAIFSPEPVYHRLVKTYDQATLEALSQKAKRDNLTLKSVFLGAYLYCLGLFTYEDELTLGLVTNTRPMLEDGDKILGCFLNTIPLRFKKEKPTSWKAYFNQVEQKLVGLKKRDRTSLSDIARMTQEKSSHGNPFFDALFDFLNFHVYEGLESGLFETADMLPAEGEYTQDDFLTNDSTNTFLDCIVSVTGKTLLINYTLRRKLNSGQSLQDFQVFMDTVLDRYLHQDEQPVSQLDILPAGERRRLLEDFQGKVVARDPSQTVLSLFAHQVDRTPDSLAVRFEQESLSFAQLNEAANRLARLLVQQGVEAETLVPLLLEPGLEQIIAVLAVWKAGGAYVPLEAATPAGRLHFLLQDTEASLLLTSSLSRPSQPLPDSLIVLELDRMDLLTGSEELDNAQLPLASLPMVKPQQLAYVLYTSGSTGEPKGVMIQHNSLAHYLTNAQTNYLTPGNDESSNQAVQSQEGSIGGGSYQLLSYGFDASLTSSWLPLLAGQPLVLAPSSGSALFEAPALAQNAPYGFLKLTPAHLPLLALAKGAPFTSRLVVGGEALLSSQLQALADLGTELEIINEYGPTEATVGVTTYRFQLSQLKSLPSRLPIGKPLDNTQLYLLDSQRQLVPLGVIGEICLAGVSLARGYWNRPQLTSEKFIPHPFSQEPTARLYRTGDLGRWLPDGTLLYEGRLDEQVKIRGYRIEPGEIEAVLVQSGRVEQAVVVSQASGENSAQLLAYVVAKGEWDPEGVQAYLAEHLPSYLLPSQLVVLPQLPLTTNGKIDKAALPLPQANPATTGYVAPRNELEQTIARIWQELLEVEPVGIHDDFFQLGGHSLLAIRLISAIRRELAVEIAIGDVFQLTTVESIAAYIRVNQRDTWVATDDYLSIDL